ncbi:YggT family protein [Pseudomarimonas salicorniae]|uniref:YggT family protein n=1 Tax=Pseudomarimonas salicorniae TaxID=2933270 RepID=A0ABT0GIJ9_9GAMM|nr:YggT family protein [Lysobacter sp. CAU 1642]MCK7594371.1 YggT family protein [Lysobacter sp. CAU 1642]
MGYVANAGAILIHVLFGLLIGLFVLRVLLQLVRANFYNPICQFFYKATNPVLMPMRRVFKPWRALDTAGLLVALVLCAIKVWLLAALSGFGLSPGALAVLALAGLIDFVLTLYFWLIIIRIVASFFATDSYHPIIPPLTQLTEPVLAPLRRALPALGPFDLSPLVATLGILLAQALLVAPLTDLGMALARG